LKHVLSIQSAVAYGHVGNSAAVFPLQRLGFNVWPVNTTHLSNHLGHATWRGKPAELALVSEIIAGLAELDVFAECGALLSGYLGEAVLGRVVLDALARLRKASPDAIFACDPVMGDDGIGFYVQSGVPEFLRDELVPHADIITPNRFELEFLTGGPIGGLDDALAAVDTMRAAGPRIVVATSVPIDQGSETIGTLAVDAGGAWLVRTPRVETRVHGTGDVFTALFLGQVLGGADTETAVSRAVSALHAVLETTVAGNQRELALVQAQDAFANPPKIYPAERIR
jgi:pyridoxine kinase